MRWVQQAEQGVIDQVALLKVPQGASSIPLVLWADPEPLPNHPQQEHWVAM
jgi:hypothetical protein